MGDNLSYPTDREKYPTEEVDKENFYSDDEVREMVKNIDNIQFKQEDFFKVYNCVHCGLCDTEMDRIKRKSRFLEQGFTLEGLKEMRDCFDKYRTIQGRVKKKLGVLVVFSYLAIH